MKKIIFSLSILAMSVLMSNAQSLVKDDFLSGYKAGDTLEKGSYTSTSGVDLIANQWNLTGKETDQNGSNPKLSKELTYKSYPQKDPAIALSIDEGTRVSVYSLDKAYKTGTYYLAFLLNVSKAGKTAQDILSFDANFTGSTPRGKLFVSSENKELQFRIGMNGGRDEAGITSDTYALGTTHLLVMKIELDSKKVSLFVDPKVSDKEPTPAATYTNSEATNVLIKGIQLKQRKSVQGSISGFRFSDNWKDALGVK